MRGQVRQGGVDSVSSAPGQIDFKLVNFEFTALEHINQYLNLIQVSQFKSCKNFLRSDQIIEIEIGKNYTYRSVKFAAGFLNLASVLLQTLYTGRN